MSVSNRADPCYVCAFTRNPDIQFLPTTDAKSLTLGKNIKVASWLPQNDILGHPKTRLFIGHAGMNGMLQAAYHGVPMICVPFFGDQFDNSITAKHFGMAEILYKESITNESLLNAINTVLNNPRFVGNYIYSKSSVKPSRPATIHFSPSPLCKNPPPSLEIQFFNMPLPSGPQPPYMVDNKVPLHF